MQAEGARLWLVRHGETDWNVQGIVQGQTPTGLNDRGREQARQVGRFLSERKFSAAYASDLPRAYETAEIVLAGRGLEICREVRLRERAFGKYQGMKGKDVHAARTALGLTQAGDLADWHGLPGVESNKVVWERAREALLAISEKHPGQDVMVVTHGGLLAQVMCGALGIPTDAPRRFPMANGMIMILQWRVDGFYLLSLLDPALVFGVDALDD